nr:hypothetical protein Iba_chr03aCG5090 [Ipomoea batatas]
MVHVSRAEGLRLKGAASATKAALLRIHAHRGLCYSSDAEDPRVELDRRAAILLVLLVDHEYGGEQAPRTWDSEITLAHLESVKCRNLMLCELVQYASLVIHEEDRWVCTTQLVCTSFPVFENYSGTLYEY